MYLLSSTHVCLLHDLALPLRLLCAEMAQPVRLIAKLPSVPPSLKIGDEIDRGAWGAVLEGELNCKPVAVKKLHQLLKDAQHGDNAVRSFIEECGRL